MPQGGRVTVFKRIYEREITGLKVKTAYIVQTGMSEYYIAFRKPNKGEEFHLYTADDSLRTFMSLDTAARLLRHYFVRDIRVQML